VTIDVGAGDGRAILEIAASNPAILAIGLDADAASMAEASRRASRPARRGGRPNAVFVVAAAEAPPPELAGLADLVTVRFPWGSLLRGCVGLDTTVATGIAALVRPGGTLELLLAPAGRDRLAGIPTDPAEVVEAVRGTFEPLGFELVDGREATPEEVRASGSTWARRLLANGHPADRRVTRVRLRSSPR
jgi:16S rRNA (adenine(1408)-N(1))-methyltransferase